MKRPIVIHILLFTLIVAVWAVVVLTSGASPRIQELEPEAARPGDSIVIFGENFGDSRGRGHVRITGVTPNRSDYQSWSDGRIVVRVPEETASGLVHVITPNGTSNGALFRNTTRSPRAQTDTPTGVPEIAEVSPTRSQVGGIITLRGDYFGDIRGLGHVLFASAAPEEIHPLWEAPRWRAPAVREESYVSWTDTEIRVRVPPGTAGGDVRVETRRGHSPSVQLELDQSPGRVEYSNPRTIAVQHEVAIRIHEGTGAEGHDQAASPDAKEQGTKAGLSRLYFWFPRPAESGRQRRVQELTRQGPSPVYRVEAADLYRLDNPAPGSSHVVRATTLLDVYAVSSSINTVRLATIYNPEDAFVQRFTGASAYVPRDHELVRSLSAFIRGAGRNPYKQAEAAFNRLITLLTPVDDISNIDAPTGLAAGEANAFTYATAFVAALRGNGIPARPVAGVLVMDDRLVRHYWAEFYLYGIGWVPVDAAAADDIHDILSLSAEETATRQSQLQPSDFFASLPPDRVAFSRGVLDTRSMIPESTRVQVPEMYFLAEHHEEVAGDRNSYRFVWRDLRLLGAH